MRAEPRWRDLPGQRRAEAIDARGAIPGPEIVEHQIPSCEVGEDVGTPEGIVEEAEAPLGTILRGELPALQVVDNLGLAGAALVPQDGGIASNRPQPAEEAFDSFLALWITLDAQGGIEHLGFEHDPFVARKDLLFRDGGDSLANHAFRCVDQMNGVLSIAKPLIERAVLEGVLGVMARVALMRDQVGDGVG